MPRHDGAPPPRAPSPRRALPPPVVHGGPDYAELAALGVRPEDVLDFSVNSNPMGTSPAALDAIDRVDPDRYPDRDAGELCNALARVHQVRPDEVLIGNGSVELIWLLAQVYLNVDDCAVIAGPTFGEYDAAIRRQGARPIVYYADAVDQFRIDVDDLVSLVTMSRPRVVFICNPNNPTGQVVGIDALGRLLDACGEALLVVDEAYLDFAKGVASALDLRRDPRIVVLRSMTKNFGLAGLRLGYMVADRGIVDDVGRAQPPWSVNAFAQAAGVAALGDVAHLEAGRRVVQLAKDRLIPSLDGLGWPCVQTWSNFWLVRVDDAAEARRRLLRRRILVRDCTSFGLPEYIRLAGRSIHDCERLLEAVAGLV